MAPPHSAWMVRQRAIPPASDEQLPVKIRLRTVPAMQPRPRIDVSLPTLPCAGAIFAASNAALMLAQMGDEEGAVKEVGAALVRAGFHQHLMHWLMHTTTGPCPSLTCSCTASLASDGAHRPQGTRQC